MHLMSTMLWTPSYMASVCEAVGFLEQFAEEWACWDNENPRHHPTLGVCQGRVGQTTGSISLPESKYMICGPKPESKIGPVATKFPPFQYEAPPLPKEDTLAGCYEFWWWYWPDIFPLSTCPMSTIIQFIDRWYNITTELKKAEASCSYLHAHSCAMLAGLLCQRSFINRITSCFNLVAFLANWYTRRRPLGQNVLSLLQKLFGRVHNLFSRLWVDSRQAAVEPSIHCIDRHL